MTSLLSGQRLLAADINAATPLMARVTADVSATSTTAFADATGFALTLDASATYIWDGYLAYSASETGDLKIAMKASNWQSGHWGCFAVATSSTGATGNLMATRISANYGDSGVLGMGGSNVSSCIAMPRGVITTGASSPCTLQLRFAQNTSNGTATVIAAGSWIRAWKIA